MEIIRSSLEAAFACEPERNPAPKMALERVSSLRQGKSGSIDIFRLYPPVNADYFASSGALVEEEGDYVDQVTELVRFSGSRTANLKYPRNWSRSSPWWSKLSKTDCASEDIGFFNSSSVSRELLQAYDTNGNVSRPGITYDADNNRLVAEIAIHGIVRAEYTARYKRLFLYRNGSQLQRSGNVIAFYRGVSVQAGFGTVTPEQPITVYSVISEYIADENGAWEVPPGWEDDNTYPIRSEEPLPNQDSYQQLERVHENCFLDWDGTLRYEQYTVRREQPYDFSPVAYKPKYKFDRGDAPKEGSLWVEPWSQLNWPLIYADVASRYPGIEFP